MAVTRGNPILASDFNAAQSIIRTLLGREGKSVTSSGVSSGSIIYPDAVVRLQTDYSVAQQNYTAGCASHCPSNNTTQRAAHRDHRGSHNTAHCPSNRAHRGSHNTSNVASNRAHRGSHNTTNVTSNRAHKGSHNTSNVASNRSHNSGNLGTHRAGYCSNCGSNCGSRNSGNNGSVNSTLNSSVYTARGAGVSSQ